MSAGSNPFVHRQISLAQMRDAIVTLKQGREIDDRAFQLVVSELQAANVKIDAMDLRLQTIERSRAHDAEVIYRAHDSLCAACKSKL
jgi:hypothetical protein